MNLLNLIGVQFVTAKNKKLNLARFKVINSVNIELVSNGAKLTVNGNTQDEDWDSLDLVAVNIEDLMPLIQEAYSLRKQ